MNEMTETRELNDQVWVEGRTEDIADGGAPKGGKDFAHIEKLANWLDTKYSIGGFKFGWDGIIGLLPVVGDTASLGLSGMLIFEGARLGARKRVLGRMAVNTGVDYVIGLVPFAGDLLDFANRSNARNARILHEELLAQQKKRSTT